MSWFELTAIAIGLAMDAFAVSLAAGLIVDRVTPRHIFRLAFHFGLFQFMMPILGWAAGQQFASYISEGDHWVAFGLLCFLGIKMIRDACRGSEERSRQDPTRGLTLVTLSVATSIDALAVGLGLAFLHVSIWLPAVIIGVAAAALSTVGIVCGRWLGASWGRLAEVFGGCMLLVIGAKVVIDHTGI